MDSPKISSDYSLSRFGAAIVAHPARTPMPVTLLYGRERARVARLVLGLLRTVRNAYTPEQHSKRLASFCS